MITGTLFSMTMIMTTETNMTEEQLVEMIQSDLKNERKHMLFYLQAAVMVQGLHREEIGEFLLKEAKSEMEHVEEFSRLIVQLGGVPTQEITNFPDNLTCPRQILKYAQEMEQEVADNYAYRLKSIEDHQDEDRPDGILTYVGLFYEDQLQDSQKTALELRLHIKQHSH